MSDTFRNHSSGDSFEETAAFRNAVNEMLRTFFASKRSFGDERAASMQLPSPKPVTIYNGSGAGLAQFAIVGLGDPLNDPAENLDEFRDRVSFNSASPLAGKPFAVLVEPIPKNETAKAVLSGPIQCLVSLSDLSHKFAHAIDGDYEKLASGTSGRAEILWAQVPAATQLNGAIDNAQTEIVVDTLEEWPDPEEEGDFVIIIDDEEMLVTDVDYDTYTLTVERGYDETTPATHADNVATTFETGTVWAVVILHGEQELGPQLRIVDATPFADGTVDCDLLTIDPVTKTRTVAEPIWGIDLASADTQPEGSDFLCHRVGSGVGGPTYVSLADDNTGNSLTDTGSWAIVDAWAAGSYSSGDVVLYTDGLPYTANTDTSEEPTTGDDWDVDTPATYGDGDTYAEGDFVRESREIYDYRTDAGGAGITSINGDTTPDQLITSEDESVTITEPSPGVVDLSVVCDCSCEKIKGASGSVVFTFDGLHPPEPLMFTDCVTEVFVEIFGAGGYSILGPNFNGAGGGGGAYASKLLTVTPGTTYYTATGFNTGAAVGVAFYDTDGGTHVHVFAESGHDASGGSDPANTPGTGGQAANGVGDVLSSGGDGGVAHFVMDEFNWGGGGGAGAGPNGDGEDGGDATANAPGLGGVGYSRGGQGSTPVGYLGVVGTNPLTVLDAISFEFIPIADGLQPIINQPNDRELAQNIIVGVVDDDTSISAFSVTFVGTDQDGAPASETIDYDGTSEFGTDNAYLTITSITIAGLTGAGTDDSISFKVLCPGVRGYAPGGGAGGAFQAQTPGLGEVRISWGSGIKMLNGLTGNVSIVDSDGVAFPVSPNGTIQMPDVPLSNITAVGAAIGDVPTWNGSEFAPAAPSGGLSGNDVFNQVFMLSSMGM